MKLAAAPQHARAMQGTYSSMPQPMYCALRLARGVAASSSICVVTGGQKLGSSGRSSATRVCEPPARMRSPFTELMHWKTPPPRQANKATCTSEVHKPMTCKALASMTIDMKLMVRCFMLLGTAMSTEAGTEVPATAVPEAADVLQSEAMLSVASESMLRGP